MSLLVHSIAGTVCLVVASQQDWLTERTGEEKLQNVIKLFQSLEPVKLHFTVKANLICPGLNALLFMFVVGCLLHNVTNLLKKETKTEKYYLEACFNRIMSVPTSNIV